jgi:hypothetical protein
MNAHDELKSLSPTLASLPKPTTPAAPEGYFEGLPDTVLARIRAGETVGQTQGPKVVRMWYRWAVAASLAGVVLAGYWLLRPSEQTALAASQPLTSEEIEAYVDANIDEFEDELFVDISATYEATRAVDEAVKPTMPQRNSPQPANDLTPSQQILPDGVSDEELDELLDEEFDVEDL